jgi:histone deacetylase HOS3
MSTAINEKTDQTFDKEAPDARAVYVPENETREMENYGHTAATASPEHRSRSSSPTRLPPRARMETPTDSDLANALLSLSFPPQHTTPPQNNTPSTQLPGSYPETPSIHRHESGSTDDTFHTPIREASVVLPSLSSYSPSQDDDISRTPTPPGAVYQLPSPERTPEPSASKSKTLVVIHDACIKHKFSRNVKARELASVVERPERCRASILGIAAAKARLDMEDSIDLTFDIVKSDRLGNLSDQAVTDVHGSAWPDQLTTLCDDAQETLAKGLLEIPPPYHSGDLYLGEGSHEALQGCIGSVYDSVDRILADDYDRVHVSVRPPGHHCAESMPSGFCMINNVHVAIAYAHRKYGVTRAVILDFDLHHGDGSQAIAWNINDNTNQLRQASRSPRHASAAPGLRIGYFSLHDIYSYPCEDGSTEKIQDASLCLSAHGQTIWNVHLRHHPTNASFDDVYDSDYSILFKKAARFLDEADVNDRSMVFLSAGFDASEHETKGMQRHGYNLPTHFYQRFASDAIALADRYTSGKILSVLEGGYADRAITSGTFAYMVGLAGATEKSVDGKDPQWWSVPRLTMLEKCSKKLPAIKNHSPVDADARWITDTVSLAARLMPTVFLSTDNPIDPAIFATPRMGLRERKKPMLPSTAPPSTVKKRQQRVATPRNRKSMTANESFIQDADAPPVPKPLERELSPATGLATMMETMNITNKDQAGSESKYKLEESAPNTPTPAGKNRLEESMH